MTDPGSGRRGSLVGAVLGAAWRRAASDARATTARVWRRWSLALLLGYAAASATALLAVLLARSWVDAGLQRWDESMLRALADSPLSYPAGLWFEAWGSSAFLVPMLLVAVVLLSRAGRLIPALTLIVAYLANKGLVLGAWQLWDRARPELIGAGIASPGLHSFPSGHAVNSTVMFGLLGVLWWRSCDSPLERTACVVLVGAVVAATCLGRLRLGTHWPSDVVAGIVIGVVWLVGLGAAVAVAEDRRGSAPAGRGR